MRFYEWFYDFRALRIMGKCTSRHLFSYGGLYFTVIKLTVETKKEIFVSENGNLGGGFCSVKI